MPPAPPRESGRAGCPKRGGWGRALSPRGVHRRGMLASRTRYRQLVAIHRVARFGGGVSPPAQANLCGQHGHCLHVLRRGARRAFSGSCGREFRLPVGVWPALQFAATADEFAVEDLPDCLDAEGKLTLVTRLVGGGGLQRSSAGAGFAAAIGCDGRRSPQDSWARKASAWRSDHRADHHADNLPVLGLFIDHDGAVFGVLAARSQLHSVLARSAKALQRDLRPDPGHHDIALGRVRCALDRDDVARPVADQRHAVAPRDHVESAWGWSRRASSSGTRMIALLSSARIGVPAATSGSRSGSNTGVPSRRSWMPRSIPPHAGMDPVAVEDAGLVRRFPRTRGESSGRPPRQALVRGSACRRGRMLTKRQHAA